MILKKTIKTFLLVLCMLPGLIAASQNRGDDENKGGITITGMTGISVLATELFRDFSGTATEFNNMPGPFAALEITRFFTPSLEAGAGIFYSHLKGETAVPRFSATGFHVLMQEPYHGPMGYDNRLYGPELFGRAYFAPGFMQQRGLRFFIKAGAGILFYESDLYYLDNPDDGFIFGKGIGENKSSKVSNGVVLLGGGLDLALTEKIGLKIGSNTNIVGYDFLDVVHNYDPDGNRREVWGIFNDYFIGLSYSPGGNPGTPKKRKSSGRHLPFAP